MEAFWIDDPRYAADVQKDTPLEQRKTLLKLLRPIKSSIDVILMGNHELKLVPKVGDIVQDICEELNVPYGTYSSKIEFQHRNKPLFKFYLTHGRKSINSISPDPVRKEAYLKHILQRHLENKCGDALVSAKGHCHKVIVSKPIPKLYLTNDGERIRQNYTTPGSGGNYIPPEHRYFCATGSFLKSQLVGMSCYSEIAEYDPVELGYCRVIIRDRKVVDVESVII